jgi:hypothetical protein
MTNKSVRRDLLSHLRVTKQALSHRAKTIKEKFGPMTTEEAVYVIAHMEGLDLSRHLSLDQLDRVRALVPRSLASKPLSSLPKARSKKTKATTSYPLVPARLVAKAVALGQESYPNVVVLETSIRNLIEQRLAAVKRTWWPDLIHPDVITAVARTKKKEAFYPYRERRGDKDILYCNFADLKKIVDHQYLHFKDVIVDLAWFSAKMDEVYMARNNLAHSILLSKDDESRIALFYRDWARMLQSAGLR